MPASLDLTHTSLAAHQAGSAIYFFISRSGTRALVVWGPPQIVTTIHIFLTEEQPTGAQWAAWGRWPKHRL